MAEYVYWFIVYFNLLEELRNYSRISFSNLFVNRKQLNWFIHHSFSDVVKSKTQIFVVVVESRSILYSSKLIYLQVDWFIGYKGNMIEH